MSSVPSITYLLKRLTEVMLEVAEKLTASGQSLQATQLEVNNLKQNQSQKDGS